MEIRIQSPNFTPNEGLSDFVIKKLEKLIHLYKRIESAEVCLKLDSSDVNQNKVCEIRLAVPGNDLFAKRRSDHFDKAVNITVAALQRQIEKMKANLERREGKA